MELSNIVTKEKISNSEYLLNMKTMGEELRNEFLNERLLEKTKGLHATLSTKIVLSLSGTRIKNIVK